MRVAALAFLVSTALVAHAAPAVARDSRCDPRTSTPLAPVATPPENERAKLEAQGAEAWRRGDPRAAVEAWRPLLALQRERGETAAAADTSLRIARAWRAQG